MRSVKAQFFLLFSCLLLWSGVQSMSFALTTSSVRVINGFVLVSASIEGQDATFILDSGCPEVVVNTRWFRPSQDAQTSLVLSLNGQQVSRHRKITSLQVAGVSGTDIDALCLDLSELEKAVHQRVDGLVGLAFFNGHVVCLDFVAEHVALYTHTQVRQVLDRSIAIPLQYRQHLPVIRVHIAGKDYNLGLDTGSKSNLFCADQAAILEPGFMTPLRTLDLVDISQTVSRAQVSMIHEIYIEGLKLEDMEFVLCNLEVFNNLEELPVDGLLGYPFFKDRKVIIDYENRMLYIVRPIVRPAMQTFSAAFMVN